MKSVNKAPEIWGLKCPHLSGFCLGGVQEAVSWPSLVGRNLRFHHTPKLENKEQAGALGTST